MVRDVVLKAGVDSGLCVVFCPHTTAALTINENADPDVCSDMEHYFEQLIPKGLRFDHAEGNSDAHIMSTLVGVSETLIIENGQLMLGVWQGIYFCEFDGPRNRQIFVKIIN